MIELGPFRLDAFVAGGGMGTVWSGQHVARGTPVAIKVVGVPSGELPAGVQAELEALARLTHPNIVALHGYGRLPDDLRVTDARLMPGALWMAMELADRGTLDDLAPSAWPDLLPALLDLLDALAYAHARDVIHRDIKAANVLISGANRQIKLSDFGIAFALEKVLATEGPLHAGTPGYMPPEQETGDAILQGPWTDIFAFGVMVWKVLTGAYPWGPDPRRFLFRKMTERPEKFEPRFAVPAELEGWLRTCMRARAELRFATAADAAHALRSLPAVPGRRVRPREPREDAVSGRTLTDQAAAPTVISDSSRSNDPRPGPASTERGAMPTGRRPPPPPMHTDGLSRRELGARGLVNAGLELITLREQRTIGRETERRQLWDALVRVRRTGGLHAVALEGPPGVGKSHLALALARRAHELGAAHTASIDLEGTGPGKGFRGFVARMLRTTATRPDEVRDAVAVFEPFYPAVFDDDTEVFVDVLAPPDTGAAPAAELEAVTRLIRRMAAERPVVLVVDGSDDAGPAVGRLLTHLAARGLDLAALVVFAAPVPPDRSFPWLERIPLDDLPEDDRVSFVRELLGLDPALAQRVARISAGNPGFANQLVRSWAQRGLLEPGPSGYQLKPGVRAPVPRAAFAAWGERIDALVEQHPAWDGPLQLAAVIGQEVDRPLWESALGRDRTHAEPLVAALVTQGLARRESDDGFTFATRALVTALLDRAQKAGHLRAMHDACATALGRSAAPDPDRLARHLLGAGRFTAALDPLLDAADRAYDQGRYPYALELLDDWERAAERVGLPAGDPRRGRALITRAGSLTFLFRKDELLATCEDAVHRSIEHGWHDTHVAALVRMCWNPRMRPAEVNRENLQIALGLVEEHGLDGRRAEVLNALAHLDLGQGRLEDALKNFREGSRQAQRHGGRQPHTCAAEEAATLTFLGRMEEATALALESYRLATEARSTSGRALANHHLGQIRFLERRYREAADAFDRAGSLCRQIGDGQEWYLRALVGLCARMLGENDRARDIFRECLDAPLQFGVLIASCGMVTLTAADPAWDLHMVEIEKFVASGSCNAVMARMLELAGEHALEAGRPDRALRAWEALEKNLTRLGEHDEAEDLRRVLDKLRGG